MRRLLIAAVLLSACRALATAQVYAPVTDEDDDAGPSAGPQAITGAGVRESAKDKAPSAKSAPASTGASAQGGADAGASGGSGTPGPSNKVPVKLTNVHVFPNIPALPEHQAAHGILRLGASGEAWAVGMTAYSNEILAKIPGGAGAASGSCLVSMSPRAFSDQGCELWVWISEKPAGPPLSSKCLWAQNTIINDATNVGGHWYTAKSGGTNKDWDFLCNVPKNGQRYYCNYSAGGWDSKYRPKKCDGVLNFPMDSMPQDVYPDSFPH